MLISSLESIFIILLAARSSFFHVDPPGTGREAGSSTSDSVAGVFFCLVDSWEVASACLFFF